MTLRTVKYMIKEGAVNIYKNKLMSIASISIVTASLVVFGIFFMMSLNISSNMRLFGDQPEIVVFCQAELNEEQAEAIEKEIKSNDAVSSVRMVTKAEYFESVKEMFAESEGLIDDLDESFLPVKFNLMLKDFDQCEDVANMLEDINGVWDVQYPRKVVDFISSITYWLRFLSILLIAVLMIIAMFIMENTIKLTMHARQKEIDIMKYIGATDWFIRWPFIVEGVIIGFIGAMIAFLLVAYGYSTIEHRFNEDIIHIGVEFIRLIKIGDISFLLVLLYLMMGTLIGSLGSYLSIRRYLEA